MSDDRATYVERVKSRLDEWNVEIETLEARASKASDDARAQLEKTIAEVREDYQEARARLDGVRHARGDAWQDLKDGMQKAWADLRQSIDDASSRIG